MDKINETMSKLEQMVADAKAAAEKGATARSLAAASNKFATTIADIFGAEDSDTASLPEDAKMALTLARRNASAAARLLAGQAGGDREAGDKLARALVMATDAGWVEGDDADRAAALVAAWTETAPKGGKGGGGRKAGTGETKTDLPFPVTVKCEAHGWSATQSTTKNSLRWAAILHHVKDHGSKPSKGSPIHQGLTDAIEAVVGGAAAGDGGGYLVTRGA